MAVGKPLVFMRLFSPGGYLRTEKQQPSSSSRSVDKPKKNNNKTEFFQEPADIWLGIIILNIIILPKCGEIAQVRSRVDPNSCLGTSRGNTGLIFRGQVIGGVYVS